MTTEQEKAIETLKKFKDNELQRDKLELNRTGGWKIGDIYKFLELNPAIETVLNLIKDQTDRINYLENNRKQVKEQVEAAQLELSFVIDMLTDV